MKGMPGLTTTISYILRPHKRKLIKQSKRLKNKTGIEIGGPSRIFSLRGFFPVYLYAKQIDGVNFSTHTLWEGNLEEGMTYNYYDRKTGHQFILEASDLSDVKDNCYDFLLSSHSLEHIANPIKALKEWHRVVKPDGTIVLVVPDKENTFDNKRPYTEFDHLLEDYEKDISEHDSTHFEEVLELHDFEKDAPLPEAETFKERVLDNYNHRVVHHHVFDFDLLETLLLQCGFKPFYKQKISPFHLVILARK